MRLSQTNKRLPCLNHHGGRGGVEDQLQSSEVARRLAHRATAVQECLPTDAVQPIQPLPPPEGGKFTAKHANTMLLHHETKHTHCLNYPSSILLEGMRMAVQATFIAMLVHTRAATSSSRCRHLRLSLGQRHERGIETKEA